MAVYGNANDPIRIGNGTTTFCLAVNMQNVTVQYQMRADEKQSAKRIIIGIPIGKSSGSVNIRSAVLRSSDIADAEEFIRIVNAWVYDSTNFPYYLQINYGNSSSPDWHMFPAQNPSSTTDHLSGYVSMISFTRKGPRFEFPQITFKEVLQG